MSTHQKRTTSAKLDAAIVNRMAGAIVRTALAAAESRRAPKRR